MPVLLGLDIGTSNLAAVALDSEAAVVACALEEPNTAALPTPDKAAELDPDQLIHSSLALLRRLMDRPELRTAHPAALGLTGQMHGLVLADQRGDALTPFVSWQDRRGASTLRDSDSTYAQELSHRLGESATHASGCRPAAGYGGVTLLRMREEALIPPRATALTIAAMLVFRLCGRAVLDPTEAASWGIFDVMHGARWLPEVEDALRIAPGVLPHVLPTGARAGTLRPEPASAAGLPSDLPVAVALGDNQASFLGSVPSLNDTALFNIGTGGQVSVPVEDFTRAQGLETRPLVHNLWLLVGASLCSGRAYELLEGFFARVGSDLFGLDPPDSLFGRMNRLAQEADPDCGGLRAGTLFQGTRSDPARRGFLRGIGVANLTPANLTRAIIAGIADELVSYYHTAQQAAGRPAHVVGSGGALRRNPVLREELERRLGARLRFASHKAEAAVGAAIAGGVAAGVYQDWHAAARRCSSPNA